jgi:hypothetical protein
MGTSMELVLPKLVEILSPEGEYEKKRIALRDEYGAVLASAKKLTTITNAEDEEVATQHGRLLMAALKETETFFKGVKVQIDSIKAPVLSAEKQDSIPYLTEKNRLGELQTIYRAEQRRLREAEERRLREIAEKEAEEDALQRAIELAAAGDEEASEAMLAEPIIAAPVVVPAAAPKPTGSVAKKNYSIRVTDLKALVAAVAAGKVLPLAVVANEAWLGAKARNEKEAFCVPGVELVITESTSFRS